MSYSYVTPEELRSMALPVTDAQWEKVGRDKLESILEAATQNIKDYLDRDLEIAQYIELIPGSGRSSLIVNNYPIVSVDALASYDSLTSSVSFSPSDLYLEQKAGIIKWRDSYHNAFYKSRMWQVTYTAGLISIPEPVKHAIGLQAVEMLQPIFRGGTNFTQVTLIENLTEQMVDLLEFYKRKRIG